MSNVVNLDDYKFMKQLKSEDLWGPTFNNVELMIKSMRGGEYVVDIHKQRIVTPGVGVRYREFYLTNKDRAFVFDEDKKEYEVIEL